MLANGTESIRVDPERPPLYPIPDIPNHPGPVKNDEMSRKTAAAVRSMKILSIFLLLFLILLAGGMLVLAFLLRQMQHHQDRDTVLVLWWQRLRWLCDDARRHFRHQFFGVSSLNKKRSSVSDHEKDESPRSDEPVRYHVFAPSAPVKPTNEDDDDDCGDGCSGDGCSGSDLVGSSDVVTI